jgi:hypothetical protein
VKLIFLNVHFSALTQFVVVNVTFNSKIIIYMPILETLWGGAAY